jgi:hypothetical protein
MISPRYLAEMIAAHLAKQEAVPARLQRITREAQADQTSRAA